MSATFIRTKPATRLAVFTVAWFLALCIAIALLDSNAGAADNQHIVGFLFGSLLGLPTLIGCWTALGPGPLWLRWLAPWPCIAMLVGAIALNAKLHKVGADERFFAVFGLCLFGQWMALQALLWPTKRFHGWSPRLPNETAATAGAPQFTIRHLMIFTSVVAVILGVGRVLVPQLAYLGSELRGEEPLLAALAVVAVIVTAPVLVAALTPRWTALCVLGTLLFVAAITYSEHELFSRTKLHPSGSPGLILLACLNGFSTLAVLVPAVAARIVGYRWAAPAASE